MLVQQRGSRGMPVSPTLPQHYPFGRAAWLDYLASPYTSPFAYAEHIAAHKPAPWRGAHADDVDLGELGRYLAVAETTELAVAAPAPRSGAVTVDVPAQRRKPARHSDAPAARRSAGVRGGTATTTPAITATAPWPGRDLLMLAGGVKVPRAWWLAQLASRSSSSDASLEARRNASPAPGRDVSRVVLSDKSSAISSKSDRVKSRRSDERKRVHVPASPPREASSRSARDAKKRAPPAPRKHAVGAVDAAIRATLGPLQDAPAKPGRRRRDGNEANLKTGIGRDAPRAKTARAGASRKTRAGAETDPAPVIPETCPECGKSNAGPQRKWYLNCAHCGWKPDESDRAKRNRHAYLSHDVSKCATCIAAGEDQDDEEEGES